MKNNKIWLGILIGVLVSIIVGLTCFIVYDKLLNDNSADKQVETDNRDNLDNSSQEEATNEFTNIDVNSQIVSSAMSLLLNKNNSNLSSSCFIQYEIYYNYAENIFTGKIDMTNFDNDDKLQLIYENISSNNKPNNFESDKEYYIDADTFDASAKKVFGNGYIIPEEGYSGCGIKISYDRSQQKYKIMEALGGDLSIVTATNNYISAKKNNNTLVVVEKVKFLFPDDIVTEEVKQNYSKDLILEYTFKKDSNDNFYFYSIESI